MTVPDSASQSGCERWKSNRVLGSGEATLKPGMRHVYSKRTYYLDEGYLSALASTIAGIRTCELYVQLMMGGQCSSN